MSWRLRTRWVMATTAMAVLVLVAQWPVTTRVGVNYSVTSQRVPLYEKAVNFLSRDLQTGRISQAVVAGTSTDEEKLMRILGWVTEHVRAIPVGFPVIDDHALHILIRGYGAEDQRTEAFVLLAGYSGFKSSSVRLKLPGSEQEVTLALVAVKGRVLVFDVVRNLAFRNEHGKLADLREMLAHSALMAAATRGTRVDGVPYAEYLLELRQAQTAFSRVNAQQPWPRVLQEMAKWFGGSRPSSHERVQLDGI